MPEITIAPPAAKFIAEKCDSPAVAAGRGTDSIPRLKWASRVTWRNASGVTTELGPRFFFSWASREECLKERDLIVNAPGVGPLALAPGSLLASGGHIVDLNGDHLVLTPPIAEP
jgi:hypothetical protein